MTNTITKDEAISLYGSAEKLADALGIERQAVYMWKADAIPVRRYLQLRYELKKDWFNANGRLLKKAKPS